MAGKRFMGKAIEDVRLEDFLIHAQKIRADIELDRNTAEHWNSLHPNEEPLVVDYSEVEKILDETLAKVLAKSEGTSV